MNPQQRGMFRIRRVLQRESTLVPVVILAAQEVIHGLPLADSYFHGRAISAVLRSQ